MLWYKGGGGLWQEMGAFNKSYMNTTEERVGAYSKKEGGGERWNG